MDLLTIEFWPVFLIFLIFYYLLPHNLQNTLLLAAGIAFIYSFGILSLAMIVVSTILSYGIYLKLIGENSDRNEKKKWLIAFIVFQIAVLFYFKLFMLTFPVGISYYTFTMIAFLMEIFWKRTSVQLSFSEYFTSLTFFPVIMLGPIERLNKFSSQLQSRRFFNLHSLELGLYHIMLGFFKLTAISNALNPLIQHKEVTALEVQGWGLISYCFLSFFKLYTEFSGFIDVITGIALFMGLKISKNFDRPYLAVNVNDVWRRWHISLTSWLKDYVFLPLVLKTKNIIVSSIVVFILVGLWHGIRVDFFYWSFYWIICYLIHALWLKIMRPSKNVMPWFLKVTVTLFITCMSTLAFMIPFSGLVNLLKRLWQLNPESLGSLSNGLALHHINMTYVLIALVLMISFETFEKKYSEKFLKSRILILVFLTALLGEFTLGSLLYLKI